jgi:hypothetical protein
MIVLVQLVFIYALDARTPFKLKIYNVYNALQKTFFIILPHINCML